MNDGSCQCKVGYAGNPCTECPINCDNTTGCNDAFNCYACKSGFFGDFCNQTCSHCKDNTCNQANGTCTCKVGFAGHPCTRCPINCDNSTGCDDMFHCHTCNPGFYDYFCNETCSELCLSNTCSRDGRCLECDPGSHGDFCNLTCSINCINGTCNRDGSCTCKKGFDGLGCCPENCKGGCNDRTFVCASYTILLM